jgi:hypothetical protein
VSRYAIYDNSTGIIRCFLNGTAAVASVNCSGSESYLESTDLSQNDLNTKVVSGAFATRAITPPAVTLADAQADRIAQLDREQNGIEMAPLTYGGNTYELSLLTLLKILCGSHLISQGRITSFDMAADDHSVHAVNGTEALNVLADAATRFFTTSDTAASRRADVMAATSVEDVYAVPDID